MRKLLTLAICLVSLFTQAGHTIIPEPVSYSEQEGSIEFDGIEFTNKSKEDQIKETLNDFKDYIYSTGLKQQPKNALSVKLKRDKSIKKTEGYNLVVNNKGVTITANSFGGFFYGIQTLKQLIPSKINNSAALHFCSVEDYPRFEWRGLMLDVSRHFFTVDQVKAYIDKMSEYKFNKFHWHLTDDEGWRVEIKSLPKLTEVGAWRGERAGRFGEHRSAPTTDEPKTYGGFYTQEQIKDVVKYATQRNITIIPEIDVPGHSMALLAAYPELSTKGEQVQVSVGHKFAEWFADGSFKMNTENMLNPADEEVYKTLDKIYTEIAELFPGEYIHMGGDECYKGYWEESKEMQKFMKKKKLKDMHDLQAYFVDRVQKIIKSKGKKMIGWDEITEGHLNKDAAVMSWQGMKGGIKAAKQGNKVVMSPTTYVYLDYTQGDKSVENPIYADLNLEKTYEFEPVPEGIDPSYIMGGQANLWTEVVPTLPFAFYMTYPRALSVSETLWSPKAKKNWNNFVVKTLTHFQRFDQQNINISHAVLDPIVEVYKAGDKMMCKLKNNIPNTKIFYTIDNTYPVQFGKEYTGPFEIPAGDLSLRTQTFLNGTGIGRSLQIHRDDLKKRL